MRNKVENLVCQEKTVHATPLIAWRQGYKLIGPLMESHRAKDDPPHHYHMESYSHALWDPDDTGTKVSW